MRTLTFRAHEPFCQTPTDQEISVLRCRGAPGEPLSASFSIEASPAVAEVTLSASSLVDHSNVIAGTAIDLHIVKRWSQAGIGVYQSAPQVVGELLLKDDRVRLSDRYSIRYAHWRHLFHPVRYYVPPDVRLHGEAVTTLEKSTPKQVWVSLRIPAATPPGTYRGRIDVSSASTAIEPHRLPVEVEVLPIALSEPKQDLLLWFRGTLDPFVPQHYLRPAAFRAQLRDIREHGFQSLSLHEYRPSRLQRALDMASEAGFRRHVILPPHAAAWLKTLRFHGMSPLFYVSDEMDRRGEPAVASHITNSRLAREQGGRTMISLLGHGFGRRLLDDSDVGHRPDVVSYYLPENTDYFRAFQAFPELRTITTYYHWASHMEKPNVHRVLAGLYLWKSGASGIAPYCYQHLPRPPFSPFDDFDEWDPAERTGRDEPAFKDHMTTYPARSGPIPTLQWKGLSAGLYDLRYLTTLADTLERVSNSPDPDAIRAAEGVRDRLQKIIGRIGISSINIASTTDPEPYADIAASEYEQFRRAIADDIVLLQACCPAGERRA